ncbi:hypothetical protein [Nodularia chucula]|uniref:hypothetical protein n=1 Tax=Nodularia chucula TaxID=3093667 RepID=UPI0039C6B7DB
MATIKIYDLYPIDSQQVLNQITEEQMKILEGRQGIGFMPGINNINNLPLSNRIDNNLDNLIFRLRNQMGTVIFGASNFFNEGLNSF